VVLMGIVRLTNPPSATNGSPFPGFPTCNASVHQERAGKCLTVLRRIYHVDVDFVYSSNVPCPPDPRPVPPASKLALPQRTPHTMADQPPPLTGIRVLEFAGLAPGT
jgi:hypothetical protein